MRELLGYIFEAIGGLAVLCLCFEMWRYWWRESYQRGYAKGWKDAENWVVTLETDVDQERQKIWREEAL